MQVFNNAISLDTVEIFREHHEKYKDDKNLNVHNSYGIDVRTNIKPGHRAWDEIKKICIKHFPDITDDRIHANYQRQSKPTYMHVDELSQSKEDIVYTIIIPMHTDERVGAVFFNKHFLKGEELQKFVEGFDYDNSEKKSNVSEQINIRHTPTNYKKENDYLADYMDLQGVFRYKIGDYVLFDGNHLHCSSDFTVFPEYQHKDLVQLHIGHKDIEENKKEIYSKKI